MQYPLISEYVAAIRDAKENLDELAYLEPVLDNHGEPYRSSGAFAVVFKMKDPKTGRNYALKCFTDEQEGRGEAYRQIAEELEFVDSTYITAVKYLEQELFVDSSCNDEVFPVLLMDWVDGETMETYVADHYADSHAMAMLCYRFCKMAGWLRSQSFAHGDIKPDNIMVRPDGTLTLVDYDGMYVAAMKGRKSPTIGTKDFAHPLRTVDDFDETIDDFALAVIALSLKAISLDPSLYTTYGASDRLLFAASDFLDLSKSKVLAALQSLLADEELKTLLSMFLMASAKKNLSMCSFRLFGLKVPHCELPKEVEVLSTEVTEEEIENGIEDEYGVTYSKDGKRLLKASRRKLSGHYMIKEGTKVICNEAFYNCSLFSIDIPNSVTRIGNEAFSGCESLTSINIPDSVIKMEGNPFAGWKGSLSIESKSFIYENNVLFNADKTIIIAYRADDESYNVPGTVTSIGDKAFYECESLTNINIPDSVTSIGKSAFYRCKSLTSINIPDSVTSIGNRAFYRCTSLSSINIPGSVTSIGGWAFSRCESLTSINIPDSVISIGNSAFETCTSLASINIPNSVTSIGDSAFCLCKSLTSINIPESVIKMEGNPFAGWYGSLYNESKSFIYEDHVLLNADKTIIIAYRAKDKTYNIPDSVTRIGNLAFYWCESLTSINIPDSVTSIGDSAFGYCSSLTSINMPNSVTTIGNSAFHCCSSLTHIYIPNSVTSIGNSAFDGCRSLTSINIPDSVTSIGNKAFSWCDSLTSINIPDSVTSIGESAFYSCKSLANIYIPNSVTSIGNSAFSWCRSLTSINIPDSVTSIGNKAFSECKLLTSINIPHSVTTIGNSAFDGCESLTSINIPDSVTSIGDFAFKRCFSLTNINIPNGVTSIGNSAFNECESLTSINIPNSVTSIGNSAFFYCI